MSYRPEKERKNKKGFYFRQVFALFLLLISVFVQGQTKKVLFIGNSYTINNNLPQITANVASSAGDQIIFSTSAYPSYTLQQHASNATTLSLIRQGGWDFVVLQEFSQSPSEPLSYVQQYVYPYATSLNNEVNAYNSNAETMFYMTWGRKDGDAARCPTNPDVCTYIGMDDLTRERYMAMAQMNQAVVSPVGAVWRYIRENYPSIELYDTDGSHPSAAGSYAAACCFYAAIFRKDPGLITYNYTVNPTDAARIRNAAKIIVYNDLLTWFIGTYDKFNITASAGTHGTITPSGTISLNSGNTITFNMTPDPGYEISNVRVDNSSVGPVSSYTFSNVSANHTISVTFTAGTTFTITSSSGTGGSITPTGSIAVNQGGNQPFSISANTGYQISDVTIDGVSAGPVSSYTFTNVQANHTISAIFGTIPTHTITASGGGGGSITPSGTITVNEGTNQTYNIRPNTGYRISNVLVDGVSAGAVTSYTFSNITSNHTISASFVLLTFTISSSAGSNGTISPSGSRTVNYGSSQTYTFSPNTGFQVANVLVDGVSVGAVSSYTFSMVITNHTISATFEVAVYTLSASAGAGGSINPSGSASATYGTSRTYTITPSTGYRILDVLVDNSSVGSLSSYTFSNISSNHSISATFAILTYTLSSLAGPGGSVTPAGDITVNYGTNRSFSITPNTGYHIVDVLVDNISSGPVSSYTFSNITSNHSISATFQINTYTLTSAAGTGGSVTPPGATVVTYGSNLTYTFTPDIAYLLDDVKIDNISIGPVNSYTFRNITSNHTVSVSFKIKMFNLVASSGAGGSISPPGTSVVQYGTNNTYTMVPVTGYRIADVLVDNISVGAVSQYTFSNVTTNHNISVSFAIITFTLTAESNTGGTVTPNGASVVNYGTSLEYTFAPDYGFRILDVKADGISAGKVSSYKFTNIVSDHSISVTFEPIPVYTISAYNDAGGTITPSGSVSLFEGTDQTYLIVPQTGYRILDVIVDNNPMGAVTEFTFDSITSDHIIAAKFTDRIDVSTYPNPFADEFKLFIATPEGFEFDFIITDFSGKVIRREKDVPGNTVIEVPVPGPDGYYVIRVFSAGKQISALKIVKYRK